MAWISPTGHNDPDGKWGIEVAAYDDDTETNAGNAAADYDHYLELTIAEILCDKVRILAQDTAGPPKYDPDLDIDMYYGGAWHNIWSGVIAKLTWVEKAIGSSQLVTKARIKSNTSDKYLQLYEFDFGEAGETHYGAATLSGVGTLAGIGHGVFVGKSTLTGIGTLATIGSFLRYAKATLSGTGTLAAKGVIEEEVTAPTAITQAASNIEGTSARINGKISDDGGASCEARFRWRKTK